MLILGLFLSHVPKAGAGSAPQVSAGSAVLMRAGGELLFEKSPERQALIASTTKIMTAVVALENSSPEDSVLVDAACCGVEGSSMYLEPGERYTVRELLQGLLLVSGNDAALALALHTAGSVEAFARLMNRKALDLGMEDSHFVNPHGLDAPGHHSTAADLAKLMDYAMNDPEFAAICGLASSDVQGQTLVNHNRLLSLYPGCIGGKTGYTQAAGRCLVTCCERDGLRLICVTLSAPDDWNDHKKLYDWAYSNYSLRDVTAGISFSAPVVSGLEDEAELLPGELRVFAPNSAEIRLEAELPWFVFAPVTAGEAAGRLTAYIDGREAGATELFFAEDVALAGKAVK